MREVPLKRRIALENLFKRWNKGYIDEFAESKEIVAIKKTDKRKNQGKWSRKEREYE